MHIVIVVIVGFDALAAFYFGAPLCNRGRQAGAVIFVWVWLTATLINGMVGVLRAGIPVLNEIGAFIPIFGIPALAAWYLATRHGVDSRAD
jgi:hypothetical protein